MRIHLKRTVTTSAGRAKTARACQIQSREQERDGNLTGEIEQRQQKQRRHDTDVLVGGFESLKAKSKSKGDKNARHNDAHSFDEEA